MTPASLRGRSRLGPPRRSATGLACGALVLTIAVTHAAARDLSIRVAPAVVPPLTGADLPSLPTPNPFGTDGPPWPAPPNIVDGQTRFLTSGPAAARCPRDRIVFVAGVVNPYRSTLAGDGAFMCHADAVAEGFVGD